VPVRKPEQAFDGKPYGRIKLPRARTKRQATQDNYLRRLEPAELQNASTVQRQRNVSRNPAKKPRPVTAALTQDAALEACIVAPTWQ
jgi:hypothetical protein